MEAKRDLNIYRMMLWMKKRFIQYRDEEGMTTYVKGLRERILMIWNAYFVRNGLEADFLAWIEEQIESESEEENDE